MDPDSRRHIYKYFSAEDRFVRIRLSSPSARAEASEIQLEAGQALSAEGYRQAVVRRFVELEDTHQDAAQSGLSELFSLVVDVNPHLELGAVRLGEKVEENKPQRFSADAHKDRARPDERARRLQRLAKDVPGRLGRRVFGQPEALAHLGAALQRAALGFCERGPLAALLLLGPSGVGKTELARALAAELGGESSLLCINCTEFAEGHEYAKLLGAPPGYVGHPEGGQLARAFRGGAPTVVLFDEVEKAHPQLHNLLLQILDEGLLTDSSGRKLDFSNCFVILTSNTGSSEVQAASAGLGFHKGSLAAETRREILERALARSFRPELLARLDATLCFNPLGPREAQRIAQAQLTQLASKVRRRGMRVRFSSAVARWVAERGLAASEGARGILHTHRRQVEGRLAAELLSGKRGAWVSVSVRRGELCFKTD